MKAEVEARFNIQVHADHVLVPWLLRHSAWCLNRFHRPRGGHTPYYMIFGKETTEAVFLLGEKVLARRPGPRTNKFQPNLVPGIWVGKSEWSGEHFVLSPEGATRHRAVKRPGQAARWDADLLQECKGLPWAAKPPEPAPP